MPNNLPGTSGQVLVSQGPGVAPIWKSAANLIKTFSSFATRTSVTGTAWVDVTGLTQGNIDTKNYIKILGTDWDENHMSVIAFLYNATTKEIVQVEQKEVIE